MSVIYTILTAGQAFWIDNTFGWKGVRMLSENLIMIKTLLSLCYNTVVV
jgi:hypothetical protein